MSERVTSAVKVFYEGDGPAQSFVAVRAAAGDVEDGWYPLIPIGKFRHAVHGEFDVSPEDAAAYVEHFDAGLPFGNAGIPIDEDGFHRKQAEAYAWIEKLEARGDALYGYIAWADNGKAAIAAGSYRYLSPTFWPRGRVFDKTSGANTDNLIQSAALTNNPFFSGQPGLLPLTASYEFEAYHTNLGDLSMEDLRSAINAVLGKRTSGDLVGWYVEEVYEGYVIVTDPEQAHWHIEYAVEGTEVTLGDEKKVKQEWVAASAAATPPDPSVQSGAETPPEVTPMDEKRIAEIREQYVAANGDVTDEAWAKLTGEFATEADWTAFGATIKAPEGAGETPPETPETLTISRADLEALQERAKAGDTAAERQEATEKELAAVNASVTGMKASLRRTELEGAVRATSYGGKVPGGSAVTALVDLQMNPCDQTVQAMMDHLAENDGHIALYTPGETDAVQGSTGATEDERWFENLAVPEDTKAAVRAIVAEKSCAFQAAYTQYLDNMGQQGK